MKELYNLVCLLETGDQTPCEGEEHVRDVVWLSDNCKPAVDHDIITSIRFDCLGVLDGLPGHLRERLALDKLPASASVSESVLLSIGAVPHPIEEDVRYSEQGESKAIPPILRGVPVGQVERTMAVSERHSGHVPEGEQEPEFFKVHVPSILSDGSEEIGECLDQSLITYQLVMIISSALAHALVYR